MNRRCTFFAVALMAMTSFTVHAEDSEVVGSNGWIKGNYFYLKYGTEKYLAIDAGKQDSVIIRDKPESNKNSADLALWEITNAGTETSGNVYQFVNKRTKKVLSFAKDVNAEPILADGVDKWAFSETGEGKISAKLTNTETMILSVDNGKLVFKGGAASFSVVKPEKDYPVTAKELGNGFTTFQLSMGEKIEGDIFSGKDLIATIATNNEDYLMLQEKGNEAYENGVKKYFGIDTIKIDGADKLNGVLGYSFSLDSIRTMTGKENAAFKLFKFTVDLKNDSLTMIVKSAPEEGEVEDVRVAYVKLDDKKVLTAVNKNSTSAIYPYITAKRGTPAVISTGTGVYFLKSASKGADGGKYIVSYDQNKIQTMSGTPSVNQLKGQWYIKEEGGLYSIVDRTEGKTLLSKGEVFAVQGMPNNTYTFEGLTDTITIEYQKVAITDKFLGSLQLSKDELSNNGYILNLIPESTGASLFVLTSGNDPVLKIEQVDQKEAMIFKLLPSDTVEIGGAKPLGDVVSVIYYKLKAQFSNDSIAQVSGEKQLQMSNDAAVEFRFVSNAEGDKFSMETRGNEYVSANINTSDMILSDNIAYFDLISVDAPEYETFSEGHKRFTSDALSLTMNPLNFFAEMKQEGLEITKSNYETDNFSLMLIKAKASTPAKPLYFIATSRLKDPAKPEGERIVYYMVSGRDSSSVNPELIDSEGHYRVNFIANNTIETMTDDANNPALFALKITENGTYLLENQKELGLSNGTPYINVYGKNVIMAKNGLEYTVENAPIPTEVEEVAPNTFEVIGGTGEVTIRNAAGKKITLSNILGQNVGSRIATSDYVKMPAVRGVIIVSVEGEKAQKVIVK